MKAIAFAIILLFSAADADALPAADYFADISFFAFAAAATLSPLMMSPLRGCAFLRHCHFITLLAIRRFAYFHSLIFFIIDYAD
jgi:hypothetical protein